MAKVGDLMESRLIAVSRVSSLSTAIRLMRGARVTAIPVLDGRTLYGVLTLDEAERQLERWGDERNVGSMHLRKIFVEERDRPEKAAKIMVENKLNRLPVVDSIIEMRCVGVVSSTEIAQRHKKKLF